MNSSGWPGRDNVRAFLMPALHGNDDKENRIKKEDWV
jgi:hypothetical protein